MPQKEEQYRKELMTYLEDEAQKHQLKLGQLDSASFWEGAAATIDWIMKNKSKFPFTGASHE